MASELNQSVSFRYSKNGIDLARAIGTVVTVTGDPFNYAVQPIATSATVIKLGDVASCGYMLVKNLDATNYVEIGKLVSAAFEGFIKLKAGETALFRLDTNAPNAKANTAAVNIEYWILSD